MRLTSEDEQQILKMVTGEEPLIPGDPNSRRAAVLRHAATLEGEIVGRMFVASAALCERHDPTHFAEVADELILHAEGLCGCQRRELN